MQEKEDYREFRKPVPIQVAKVFIKNISKNVHLVLRDAEKITNKLNYFQF